MRRGRRAVGDGLVGVGAAVVEVLVVWRRGQVGRRAVVDELGLVLGLGCSGSWVW